MWRSLYRSRYATASRSSMMAETDKGGSHLLVFPPAIRKNRDYSMMRVILNSDLKPLGFTLALMVYLFSIMVLSVFSTSC